ncbi:MAG: class I SAM-dependent methyltransferase, partial [Candidatus Marinimicrobia bacterium]|nr:class I SAM-dependent methyltransferase [Candidatus Neomarinimicrobiota bacterium]
LGAMRPAAGLLLGGDPGLQRRLLVNRPHWQVGSLNPPDARLTSWAGARAHTVTPERLPWADKTFDQVVVVDVLEHTPDDAALIAECHRVLTDTGSLLVDVPRAIRYSLLAWLQRLAGMPAYQHTYSPGHIYDALKDGFDIQRDRAYLGFWTSLLDLCDRRVAAAWLPEPDAEPGVAVVAYRRIARLFAVLWPLAYLARLADALCFFMPGQRLMLTARKRRWIPRRTPILRDGRSIAEAALHAKIGTARPF